MATNGLMSCLARLEVRVYDVGIAHLARRRAGDGVSAAEIEAEMRRFFRLVGARLGAYPDQRALAELINQEYGVPVAEAFRQVRAARKERERR